jgi:phage tail protein X
MPRYSSISTLSNQNPDLRDIGIRFLRTTSYPVVPRNPNDIFIITEFGDRLDSLAFKFYKDSSLYWVIYSANPNTIRADQLYLPAGVQLRIPFNVENVKARYDSLNNT